MSAETSKVVVAGAGLMGLGIAHAFASTGHRTIMVDVSQAALDRAHAAVARILAEGVTRGKMTQAQSEASLARLTGSVDLGAAAQGAGLLVETATESMSVKIAILEAAEAGLPDTALIATNTSALSVTELASATRDPSRVVGMHFFNPVQKMKLVELVRGLKTSEDALSRARAYAVALGKTSIVVNEAPGLTTSRMSALLGNEAMWMLQEGAATAEDIDTALRLGLNHPMGPLELGDVTGWDTRLSVLQYLHATLGEKFRPCPLIAKMVKAGRTGRKSGAGVYEYLNGEKVPGSGLRPNPSGPPPEQHR
jgi:3-hydroxybutyryl-CoA dehydrogenase